MGPKMIRNNTQCRRRSLNVVVNCHSRMELRPPTARKSHLNFFAHCKRSTKMKKYKKNIIPNLQNTMRTQATLMVSNYGKLLTYVSISKHHVHAWFMYVLVKYIFCCKTHLILMFKVKKSTCKKCHFLVQTTMWTHDSCMFWYVSVTNLWGSDKHLNPIFLQRGPN